MANNCDILYEVPYLWLNDGYGQCALSTAQVLDEFCEKHSLTWKIKYNKNISKTKGNGELHELIRKHTDDSKSSTPCNILLRHNYPSAEKKSAKKLVTYTMFETDKCPVGWKSLLDAADLVLLPTPQQVDIFSKATKTPTKLLYLPIREDYHGILSNEEIVKDLPKKFTFSFVGTNSSTDRKGMRALITDFSKIRMDVNIIARGRNFRDFPDHRIKVERTAGEIGDIVSFYLRSHCGIYPSRGEGYGLPQIETSFLGRPIIIADNSAPAWTSTMMPWVYKVPCKKGPAKYVHKSVGKDYGNWYFVKMPMFLDKMEELHQFWIDDQDAYKEKIIESHKNNPLREELSKENIIKQMEEIFLPLLKR